MKLKRSNTDALSKWFYQIDRPLLSAIVGLILVGIIMLIAAGTYEASKVGASSPLFYLIKAIIPMLFGIIAFFFFSNLPKKYIIGTSILFGAICFVLVLLTPIFPDRAALAENGSARFLKLGFLPSIQPTEFLKPFFIVISALFLSHLAKIANGRFFANQAVWKNPIGWPIFIGTFGVLCISMFMQPDFGMTVIYCATFAVMLFFAGTSWKSISVALGGFAGLFGLAFTLIPHVRERTIKFFTGNPPEQIELSMDAIRNSGIFGQAGNSYIKTKLSQSNTDFVFASWTEDRGIIFGIALLWLYFYILHRILKLMREMHSTFARLICGGTVGLITIHMVLNIGTVLNLIPAKGTILPFVSSGGSAFIAMCAVFGILLGVIRNDKFNKGN